MTDDEEITKLLSLYSRLDALSDGPPINKPMLLAHYTSVSNAQKIIESGELWFSHPYNMNDHQELQYGLNLGLQIFPFYAEIAEKNKERREILRERFNHYVAVFGEEYLTDTYILCFSKHDIDNTDGTLSMWRSYAEQGHGAAIVFNTEKVPINSNIPLTLAEVKYVSNSERLENIRRNLQI